ncbi:MAG: hypothetical protein A3F61_02400 [Candidatus Blackburnbacteria bacterium RIFCSPHIGHO2_12_FULL_41_13b]|uniref:Ribulose-phosphate 3-epimerase n=1 Tax=Candidatus Blackburnbacteria bacterium RIFCSPHIGHO2_12_FULL_41_13b TaxID=1797517 RepID=A0A1G1VAB9_9BACT|nr:MAG: hypothetical protein A3F61_02400 [Candidatus Blackburnbacteria bacterium RIFCSPHIGHO2_12_FULL_41_13b]
MEIIPAILTNDPKELEEKIKLVAPLRSESFGGVKRIQIDIIDGVFAENKTIDLAAVGQIESGLEIDVHLMVKEPVDWVEKSVRAMGDRIIGQVEMMSNQAEFIGKVQETGHQVGLALDLDTPVSVLDETLFTLVDVILLMSVKAGFGGQKFSELAIEKIRELAEIREKDKTNFKICVDGGIEEENIKQIADTGADEVAVGSSLFNGSVEENMRKLQNAL